MTVYKSSIMSSALARSISGLLRNMTGNFIVEGTISCPTSAQAIPLGQVTQPHWAFFANLDATNYIQFQNGASGAVFARYLAGDACPVPLDPGCVPYTVANTAACLLEYLIISA